MNVTKTLLLIAIALLLFLLLRPSDNTTSTRINPEEISNLISDSLALIKRDLFIKNKYESKSLGLVQRSQLSEEDFTHFSMPIKEMEDYIKYVKQVAADNVKEKVGLRFYLGAKLDPQSQIVLTEIFYGAIGVSDSTKLQKPIKYEDMERMVQAAFGDKVRCGGKPPGSLLSN